MATINGSNRIDILFGTRSDDVINGRGGVDLLFGGDGDDRIDGGDGFDVLSGGDGDDTLIGGEGMDSLSGDSGNDVLVGDYGDLIVDGGSGTDLARLDFSDASGAINFAVADNLSRLASFGGTLVHAIEQLDVQAGRGNDRITGGALDDVIAGGRGNDMLTGGGGNDTLLGGAGADTLRGDAGANILDGGEGNDSVVYDGRHTDFRVERLSDGGARIVDLRSGHDVDDTVHNIESYVFGDGSFTLDQLAPLNHKPVAVDDNYIIGEESYLTVNPIANDSDPDGDPIELDSLNFTQTSGHVDWNGGSSITYSAGAALQSLGEGESFVDTIGYSVRDDSGDGSTLGTIHITVTGVNDAPTAIGEALSLDADQAHAAIDVLANDSDIDHNDSVHIGDFDAHSAKGASVTMVDGQLVYDAGDAFLGLAEGETATDSFDYQVVDSHGAVSTATATVTIHGTETFEPDMLLYGVEDMTSENFYDQVLDTAHDLFGAGATIEAVDTHNLLGTIAFDANAHSLVYSGNDPRLDPLWGDAKANTGFSVDVRTADGGHETLDVMMMIFGTNDPTIANDDHVALKVGETTGDLLDLLLANDVDIDGGHRTIDSVDMQGLHGILHFDRTHQTLTYEANPAAFQDLAPGQSVEDSFSYEFYSGNGADIATVHLTVTQPVIG